MKIEIDFDNKVIEVKDSITIGRLVKQLKQLNLEGWAEYQLKAINGWSYVPYYPYPYYPTYIEPYKIT